MAHVVEIRDYEHLRDHHLVWSLLLPRTRGGSFFQSLEWLSCYWLHFGRGQQLRVLIIYAGDQPLGILPLTVVEESTKVGRVRVLTYPLHDWGSTFGPLGPNPTATLVAGLRHIRRTRRDWDLIDLRWVWKQGVDFGRTPGGLRAAGFPCRERLWKRTAVIDLSCGWESYFASRSSKFRNNIRRQEKQLAKTGGVSFERYRPRGVRYGDDDPRWDLFEECVGLAKRSWQGDSRSGTTLSHETVRSFFRECHEAAVRVGALDITMLRVDGQAAAFTYNYQGGNQVVGMRTGFSPEFARQGVGSVLWARTFQDSATRGDQLFDLGPDSPALKRNWLTSMLPIHHYTHYSASGKAQLLRLKHWWSESKARDRLAVIPATA